MFKKKIIVLKNDRTGDLFVSLNAINSILNKHLNDEILFFLSDINKKFSFLFPNLKKKIYSMNLNILDKINIFFYFLIHKIDTVYILTPKSFYYFLPFIFRKTKFYAITIRAKKDRPSKFFLSYLYKYVVIDRINLKKRNSSYDIQLNLINENSIDEKNLINTDSNISHNFNFPKNFVYFHYKHRLFNHLLNWKLEDISKFLTFLSSNYENILFSSELKNKKINEYFSKSYNTYDFNNKIFEHKNKTNIYFLKDIDGYDLFNAVKYSNKVIAPEGIITHIGYFLKKPVLALMHFNLKNREDFKSQIISCREWFPPKNYNFTVLKKDYSKSIKKIIKRL